ncbi:MAG: tRNA epoxyqueuosine(34) reductase QueG [Sediminibacterium sp.]|nr:tRNA epoxyqueuosine(34) reductase QueG [Sediminibacterium sp.]
MNSANYSAQIKSLAAALGFTYCGIARAEVLDEDARRLESWLQKGMQGEMQYMNNYFDLRIDPRKLVPGTRSVITLLYNYFPSEKQTSSLPQIAKYAYGEDYHFVVKDKLRLLLEQMKASMGDIHGRGFVDSAPVLERSWAVQSGLGWIGKNGNLITQKQGSFFFIATLMVDIELAYDPPMVKDYCGSCTRCIDACPTDAILPNKVVDGSKCISYFTIELKDALIPDSQQGKWNDWMFGCDTCQDVCPWNRFSKPHTETRFTPIPEILELSSSDWEELSETAFKQIFGKSPLQRRKYAGIQANVQFLKKGAIKE